MKPLNIDLYNEVKKYADEIYKKHSAYKSGFIVKTYKSLGGEYEGTGEKKLKRWFDEEWKDVNPLKTETSYPVYRPTKRVNKNTPLTVNEIDKENLIEQSIIKQKIKGKKNLKPFEGKGITSTCTTKREEVEKYSNPDIVWEKLQEYSPEMPLFFSNRSDKKYMIIIDDKPIHFGQMGYEDFTKHQDINRRDRYLKRANNIKGRWKDNKFSPNNLAINLLW